MDWSHATIAAVATVIVAAAAVIVAWFNNSRKLMGRVDELTTQMFSTQDKVFKLQQTEADCRIREMDLKADLTRSLHRIADLEVKVGMPVKSPLIPGIVICDNEGIIQEFSPSVTVFLGWLPEEMKGQPVTKMIPAASLEKHKAAFARATMPGGVVDPTRQILTYALDKTGHEVAVSITMRRWGGKDALITATITPRGRQVGASETDDAIPVLRDEDLVPRPPTPGSKFDPPPVKPAAPRPEG